MDFAEDKVIKEEAPQKKNKGRKVLKKLLVILIKIIILVVLLFVLFTVLFGFHIQKGLSMYPKLVDNDLLLYYRLDKNYHTGDIVIFRKGNKEYALRIVAIENDIVDINDEGILKINNHELSEDIFYKTKEKKGIKFPYTVPENSFFVLGDYRTNSTDSRDFGAISKNSISGKVINILRSRDI